MALFGRITGALRPVCLFAEAAMLSRPAASATVLGLPRLFSSSAEVDLIPTTNSSGAAFPKDLRSTSGLGKGDNLSTHTSKWLSEGREGPMEMIARVEPIAVESKVVACRGGQNQLGHPVEFIKVYGTSKDEPAVCKYCGLRYYFDGHH
mmetsp:Transcript_3618/g.12697  ORF Transcript_3618/g.12697 Transcript_3618/m.12697 type:complete len:149 (-) Transcript_3618:110-556(-)